MKKVLLSVFTVAAFAYGSMAQTTAPTTAPQENPNAAEFKFEKETHDFGLVKEGTQATYEFKFTNTGKDPLVISNVQASCGCTTPKWSREPIKRGESGTITTVYNSKGRPGAFNKAVTITSNAKTPSKVLYIKGSVEAAPKEEEATPLKKDIAGPTEKKPTGF